MSSELLDRDVLEMKLREISDMLSCRYEDNVRVGVPEASLVCEGTSPSTGKRMELIVTLREKEEL